MPILQNAVSERRELNLCKITVNGLNLRNLPWVLVLNGAILGTVESILREMGLG